MIALEEEEGEEDCGCLGPFLENARVYFEKKLLSKNLRPFPVQHSKLIGKSTKQNISVPS